MGYSLFVSHSGDDLEFVRAIQDAATPLGIGVYTFEQDLQPGSNLPAKLIARISASDAMVVVLTKAGASSPTVAGEIGAARQAGKPIIPLVEKGVDVGRFAFLQGLEWVEFNRENPQETLLRLSTRVARMKMSADRDQWIFLLLAAGFVFLISRAE